MNLKAIVILLPLWIAAPTRAQQKQDLSNLGIEDLMKIEVTTASKQAQDLLHVAAAIYVITPEQIRRAGATNIPEALRLAPGVDVAQIDANKWMISIRGFNSRFANKLLVLIDGRSVYTPLFSGVYWDQQEVNMDDIDRIEVIRGPGGTLWGANAVNGIINVITKKAAETQGTTITSQSSTSDPAIDSVRYGGQLGPKAFFRIYAKYMDVDSLDTTLDTPGVDGWHALRGGFRADWSTSIDSFTVTGGANAEREGQTSLFPVFTPPYSQIRIDRFAANDFNLVANWERTSGAAKGTALRASFDRTDIDSPEAEEIRNTVALDFQQPRTLSPTNHLVWGLGYSDTRDNTIGTDYVSFDPVNRTYEVASGFVNEGIDLNRRLKLTLGTKIEHNSYTGWEVQPSARILWTDDKKQSVWASVSRAVRTPSEADISSMINFQTFPAPDGTPIELRYIGSPSFKSEVVIAHEVGWRIQPSDRIFLDVTAFFNRYNNLRSFIAGTPFTENTPVFHIVDPYYYTNGLDADTAGIELASEFQAAPSWKIESSASLFTSRFRFDPGYQDVEGLVGPDRGGVTPHTQFSIRSLLNLPSHLQFDASFYYVDKLAYQNVAPICRLDARLAWHPADSVEYSIGVQNILSERHVEGVPELFEVPAFIERSFYAQVTLKF